MKLADIKVGMTVGVVKGRKADYHELPREAEVVEIVTKEERIYSRNTYIDQPEPRFKKVKWVKVKWLADPLEDNPGSRYATLHSEAKGVTRDVEPAQIVGPWSALRAEVTKRVEEKREKKEGQAALEARLIAIFGKRTFEDYITARYDGRRYEPQIEFYGKSVVHLLDKLEGRAS